MRGSGVKYSRQEEREESIFDPGCYFSITWCQSISWAQINPWISWGFFLKTIIASMHGFFSVDAKEDQSQL